MSVNNSLGTDGYPTPISTILPFMGQNGNELPTGWLFCDGRELLKADYPELYDTIGDNFNLSTTTTGYFCLPDLSTNDNYLFPSDETEQGGEGGVLPAKLQTDTDITIASSAIPSLSASNISTTYPTQQVGFARGVTYNVRGDYPESSYYADSTGTANPDIVKLNSTTETGGSYTLTSADYKFKNSNQKSITNITTDTGHGIQYGGMSVCYIIKVSSLLFDDADGTLRKQVNYSTILAQQIAEQQEAEAEAFAQMTNQLNQQQDQQSYEQAQAIANGEQGGGTEVPYADVPNLSGFVIPANPEY